MAIKRTKLRNPTAHLRRVVCAFVARIYQHQVFSRHKSNDTIPDDWLLMSQVVFKNEYPDEPARRILSSLVNSPLFSDPEYVGADAMRYFGYFYDGAPKQFLSGF